MAWRQEGKQLLSTPILVCKQEAEKKKNKIQHESFENSKACDASLSTHWIPSVQSREVMEAILFQPTTTGHNSDVQNRYF